MRECTKCGQEKPESEYYPHPDGFKRGACKRCHCIQANSYARVSEVKRASYVKRKFGIDRAEQDEMLKRQNGVCAICESPCPSGRRLAVDHCHETGRVRGLLCRNCNLGLGNFKDDVKRLQTAMEYLQQ